MRLLKKIIVAILTAEARLVLRRHRPKIIAVTGSVGKTATKDAIYAVLASRSRVRKSEKSLNSEFGVPLAVLGQESGWKNPLKWLWIIAKGLFLALFGSDYPETLVLEIGADRPGDIRRIARWVRPDIAVLTHVPAIPVHVEYFASPEDVVKEKRSLVDHLRPGGTVIVNGDDLLLKNSLSDFKGSVITYGIEQYNDFAAAESAVAYESEKPIGMQFVARHKESSQHVLVRGALGLPRVYSALAAIAAGGTLGVSAHDAADALLKWAPPPGRMRILAGANGSTLIDDTYNSSPAAALSALDTLKDVKAGRRIAILGDMLELGKYSHDTHQKVGERAAEVADMLIVVGFRSRATAEGALDAGMSDDKIRSYEMNESERVGQELMQELRAGDVVVVKGSQAMRMEKCVEALLARTEDAKYLVRQDAEWKLR